MEKSLKNIDKDIYDAINREHHREETTLELIASENFTSLAVMEAQGSVLTNKYAEGYPAKRYYGGCEHVDTVESLARDRAKELFGAEHVNVQPHSGSQANMAVCLAMLKPGDTLMGMDLCHGGHLTHGSKVSFSGKIFNAVAYGVRKSDFLIDYDQVEALSLEHKPKMIIAGCSAYSRTLDFARFREIADKVGAYLLVDMAHIAGLVAAGEHPSPIPHAHFVTTTTHKTLRGPRGGMIFCTEEHAKAIDKMIFPGIQGGPMMHVIAAKAVALKEAMSEEFKLYQKQVVKNASVLAESLTKAGFDVVSGQTDNHLMLLDLRKQNLSGKMAEALLGEAGITVNKNTIPFETESPFVTSGIRIGVPSVTTRGMSEKEMQQIAGFIERVLLGDQEESTLKSVLDEVEKLCLSFPLYASKK